MGPCPSWRVVVAFCAFLLAVPHLDLKWDAVVVPMARRYAGISDESVRQPLEGTTILITGATSGIGLALTRKLSKLGGTVVALGRSKSKLASLAREIPFVKTFLIDLGDLESVARAADEILQSNTTIDILINNAGTHAIFEMFPNILANQTYDHVFVVNYLSQFLLTEKLAGLLTQSKRQPTIVQTSSSFHWAVDGSDLVPEPDRAPIAARPGGSTGFYLFRTQRSYANSKLAQIYHARALKQRKPELLHARIVSFCPGWVGTSITRNELFNWMLSRVAFPVDGIGLASALSAVLGDDDTDDNEDYFINTRAIGAPHLLLWGETPSWFYRWGLRDALMFCYVMSGLFFQHWVPKAEPFTSSPESYNKTRALELYDWSKSAVAGYL